MATTRHTGPSGDHGAPAHRRSRHHLHSSKNRLSLLSAATAVSLQCRFASRPCNLLGSEKVANAAAKKARAGALYAGRGFWTSRFEGGKDSGGQALYPLRRVIGLVAASQRVRELPGSRLSGEHAESVPGTGYRCIRQCRRLVLRTLLSGPHSKSWADAAGRGSRACVAQLHLTRPLCGDGGRESH